MILNEFVEVKNILGDELYSHLMSIPEEKRNSLIKKAREARSKFSKDYNPRDSANRGKIIAKQLGL